MENPSSLDSAAPAPASAFVSQLRDGAARFLASVVDHALTHGRRTPEDFLRCFPPKVLMEALSDAPQLRAKILVDAVGTRMRVALKKPAASCGTDLEIALEENETDPATVVRLVDPDDRVRFLDPRALWAFAVEGDPWSADREKDPAGHALAAAQMGFLLDRALQEELLTHRDVVRGISVSVLATHLPRPELAAIVEAALDAGYSKRPFVEESLLAALPASALTPYVPLPVIWTDVIVPFVAETHGFAPRMQAAATPAPTTQATTTQAPTTTQAAPKMPATPPPPPKRPSTFPPPLPPRLASAGIDVAVDEFLGSFTEADVSPGPRKVFRVPTSSPPPPPVAPRARVERAKT